MKKIAKSVQLLLGVLLFCVHATSVAQTLNPPVLHFGDKACDTTGATEFLIDITFNDQVFNDDNKFFIELSDANGKFPDPPTPAINLRTLTSTTVNNYNQMYNILNVPFNLPPGTFGKGYVIRVRTTSPEMIQKSAPFEAYHDMFIESEIGILNSEGNENSFALCNGESKEVTLTTDIVGEYEWYRKVVNAGTTTNTLVGTTQEPKFTITQPGTYSVVVNYGKCGNRSRSRSIIVTGIDNEDAQILGASAIEICGDEEHVFEANSNNSKYTYVWYKDNKEVQSSGSNRYTTPRADQFGTYHLVVKLGDCEVQSSDVELKQKEEPSFTINVLVPLVSVILSGETKRLEIEPVGVTNYTVQWTRVGSLPFTTNEVFYDAITPGTYIAKVTDTDASSGSCEASKNSEPIVLLAPVSFETEIRADNYEECTSETTVLKIVGVKIKASDNNLYDLTDAQLTASPALISYKWKDSSGEITGATNNEYSVNSYLYNNIYSLNVTDSFTNSDSNKLDIKLIKEPEVVSTSVSNSLCSGSDITYTIDELLIGYTYEWFKDADVIPIATDVTDFIVTEIGEYTLKITGYGCEKNVETKVVVPFDDSAIVVSPSEKVVLILGQSVTITASGAESYVWYLGTDISVTGTILSTNETFDATALGFYTVVATVGICNVPKKIEVVEQDDQIIVPNIVTPNADGINDTWQISNKYSFKPSVNILLYNSNGKEILNVTDYKNDWPTESLGNQKVFYYKIIKDDALIKAGTISVLD